MLQGKNLVIGVDATERDFKQNGELYARAKLATPAVEIAFESKHGPLLYRSDKYESTPYYNKMELWQHNVRGIALTLEAARAMDRYGATQTGQQYTGFKAIGGGSSGQASGPEWATPQEAINWIKSEEVAGFEGASGLSLLICYRHAARTHHPDTGGDPEMWAKLDRAKRFITKAHMWEDGR